MSRIGLITDSIGLMTDSVSTNENTRKDKKLPFTGHKSESMHIPSKGLMVGKEEVSNKYT